MKKIFSIVLCFGLIVFADRLAAEQPSVSGTETVRKELMDKAIAYLRDAQRDNGAFSPESGIGPTMIVATGLMEAGIKATDPMVAKALDLAVRSVRRDGGVYTEGGRFQNYETSLAIMCFTFANKQRAAPGTKGPYDEILVNAEKYIRRCQFSEENGNLAREEYRGGIGYSPEAKGRPDLSNAHYFMNAMEALGRGKDDPAVKNALVFISRCQNLESEYNDLPYAKRTPDGGFVYVILTEEMEKQMRERGQDPGSVRGYASMTYAGLKSMIYAGVDKDDKRVKAALEWTQKFYDVDSNPGMGQSGLFYYYQVMSKTLDTLELKQVIDRKGEAHDWRADLVQALAKRQLPNGSWVNPATRWMEGDPNLVTGYALMVLADCGP